MSTFKNMNYNNDILTTLSVIATLAVSPIHAEIYTPNYLAMSSYDTFIDYDINKQSTIDNSKVKNDIEMLKILEIEEFNHELQSKFETTIINTWTPADEILEKSCLFVNVKNEEELISQYEDFELEIYLALEEKISKSQFFDMIALI